MARILVIEDDPELRDLLVGDLEIEGFALDAAKDGAEGLAMARASLPDLVVLDLMMPKMSGFDICRTLRKEGFNAPILILSARNQENDKVVALGLGADDYLTKPFGGLEFIARVKALLRRQTRLSEKISSAAFANIEVNFKRMEALRSGKPIELSPKEFQILELLMRHRGEVITRETFLQEVWGYGDELPTTRTVDNQVLTLRRKLGGKSSEAYIQTVHGVGYKFVG